MKRTFKILAFLSLVLLTAASSWATNGDNLIAVGPISRAMGGVGIAAPQDAISAVFSNPAAMCFGPYCPATQVDFAGTLFLPDVSAKVTRGGEVIEADSDDSVYAIPAIGISVPITEDIDSSWRFGLAAYGVTGLGVDYRDSNLDQSQYPGFGGQAPLIAGEYTQLQTFKFAPSLAYRHSDWMSVGLAVHIDYSSLDLRNGSSYGYGLGVQVGAIFKPFDKFSFGVTYVSPQEVKYGDVNDFDNDGSLDDLKLESPQQLGIGVAYEPFGSKLLVEVDFKWLNWGNANGYEDFDWEDQWVAAIGVQFKPIDRLAIRVGYNFGNNPVKEHDNFNGMSLTSVQGKTLPTYYYETFRVIGFPAVVEHHVTFGVGFDVTERFGVHLGFVHAFKNTISENGTDITGQPVELESSLSETSFDFGLTWRF